MPFSKNIHRKNYFRQFALTISRKDYISEMLWLALSLAISFYYSTLALKEGLSGKYIVHDDARQHVFWMLRYVDPDLFPNDVIADYFQSIAPLGYSAIYHSAAFLGINPLVLNKFFPMAIALISTYYCFVLCKQIFPVAQGCFVASILLNQSFWFKDDIVSATPRAFVYPFFLAFLYYLTKKSLVPCLLAIVGVGFFYPQYLLICAGLLIFQLLEQHHNAGISIGDLRDNYLYLIGLVLTCSILLFYVVNASEYGPTITRIEALQLPEFYPGGRASFFNPNLWEYLIDGGRSGLIHKSLFTPATLAIGLLLPIICRFPHHFPLVKQVQNLQLLLQLLIVSVLVFGLAHVLLFKLHLPSRYSSHSLIIIINIVAGISITVIGETLLRRLSRKASFRLNLRSIAEKILLAGLCSAIAIGILAYPSLVPKFPAIEYRIGTTPGLYQFLQQQPKDTMVASLTSETDNLPTFARRSVLVSSEYAIPYHTGYYFPFRQRVAELIAAQYIDNLETLQKFIAKYQISFLLLEESSFTPQYIENNNWLMSHQPIAKEAVENLKQGNIPVLASLPKECSVFTEAQYSLISTKCISAL